MPLTTFDVFDTVLTRAVGKPATVFLALGRRLRRLGMISCSPDEFAAARMRAEREARDGSTREDITLAEIYAHLGPALGIPAGVEAQVQREECVVEGRLLRLVPGAKAMVDAARRVYGRVIYVSDMYLPGDFIESVLRRHEIFTDGDRLYVSSSYGEAKWSGKLFKRVAHEEHVALREIIHYGDNERSDVSAPRALGCTASHCSAVALNRFEQILEAYAAETGGLSAALAGASRLARLSIAADNPHDRALRDVSAGVAAPLLVGFILWVLQSARAQNVTRLYFVSRDGQILASIARRLIAALSLRIETRYIFGSRQAWHLPSLTQIADEDLLWMLVRSPETTLTDLLRRLDFTPDEVSGLLSEQGIGREDWSRVVTPELEEAFKRFLHSPAGREVVLRRAAERRAVAMKYLEQEGLFSCQEWALVDVGWRGRCQASLGKILSLGGGPTPRGFYFGLLGRPMSSTAGALSGYFVDVASPGGRERRFPSLELVEMFCSADHPGVRGYRMDGPHAVPRFAEDEHLNIAWGVPKMQATIERVVDALLVDDELVRLDADIRPAAAEIVTAFWRSPTTEEAVAWGAYSFSSDQTGSRPAPIARSLGWRDLPRAIRGDRTPPYLWWWADGAAAATPKFWRHVLSAAARFGRTLRRVLRRPGPV